MLNGLFDCHQCYLLSINYRIRSITSEFVNRSFYKSQLVNDKSFGKEYHPSDHSSEPCHLKSLLPSSLIRLGKKLGLMLEQIQPVGQLSS